MDASLQLRRSRRDLLLVTTGDMAAIGTATYVDASQKGMIISPAGAEEMPRSFVINRVQPLANALAR